MDGKATGAPGWAFARFPITICLLLGSPAMAAATNNEAASPQRTKSAVARPAAQSPQPTRSVSSVNRVTTRAGGATNSPIPARANTQGDGVPDQSWGGPRVNVPVASLSPSQIRRVNIPVLGREGAAANRGVSAARPLSSATSPARAPAARPAPRSTTAASVSVSVTAPKPPVRATLISITASEPTLTSAVRPQDVASLQKIGAPYQVGGTWYVPAHEPDYDETGIASWYGADFQGRPTANGEIFDMNVVSGAHPTLPIPSLVEVTNLANGRSVVVRINDRGPFVANRLIDLSARGAELLGFRTQGHTNVRVRYVGSANAEPVVTAQNISVGRAQVAASPPTSSTATLAPTFVQVGAFSLRANAERLAEQSADLGALQIVETTLPDGNLLYRVVLGPVESRVAADMKVQAMSVNGISGARVLASLN